MGEGGVECDPEEEMPPLVALDAELPALEASALNWIKLMRVYVGDGARQVL